MEMDQNHEFVATKIQEIEEEMKKIGAWTAKAPDKKLFNEKMGAFGSNSMPFEDWLQFIFLPEVKERIEKKVALPPHSSVGSYAVREFDGRPGYERLGTLLYEFDKLINKTPFYVRPKTPTANKVILGITILIIWGFIVYLAFTFKT